MSRRETLLEALKDARAAHQHNPSRRTFDMMRGAANRVKQFDEHLSRLQEDLRKAKLIYNHEAIANIEGKIRMHTIASGLVSDVNLVDTAGTIRLDLNDRRVFMTRAQARELFLKLGSALDDGATNEFPVDFDTERAGKLAIELAAMAHERNLEVAA